MSTELAQDAEPAPDAGLAQDAEHVPAAGRAPNAEPPSPTRKTFSRLVDVGLWILTLGVLATAFYPKNSGPSVGRRAPVLTLAVVTPASDSPAPLREIPGKLERPLLIEAFASWCGACRRSSSLLSDLKEAQSAGTLDVVAVSVDDSPELAAKAQRTWPITVPVLHDPSGQFSQVYEVEVLPTYILVGTDGVVSRVTAGTAGASDIRAWLKAGDR